MSDSPLQRGPGGLQQRITRAAVEGICRSNVSIDKGTSRHTLPNTAGHSRLTALGHNRRHSHNVFQSGSSNNLRAGRERLLISQRTLFDSCRCTVVSSHTHIHTHIHTHTNTHTFCVRSAASIELCRHTTCMHRSPSPPTAL